MKAQCLWCYDIIESVDEPDVCECGRSFLDVTSYSYRGGGYLKPVFDKKQY